MEFSDPVILGILGAAFTAIGAIAKTLIERYRPERLSQAKAFEIINKEALELLSEVTKQKNCQIEKLKKDIEAREQKIKELNSIIQSDTIFKDKRRSQ